MQGFLKRLERDDRGFTLIELMVVVLIIAILIAIAIPTFLGARKRAQDRAAQSSARNAFTAAKTIFTDSEDYNTVTQTKLQESEPSLTFPLTKGGASDDPNTVSWGDYDDTGIVDDNGNSFRVAVYSKTGICWHLLDVTGPITGGDAGTTYAQDDVGDVTGDCVANQTGLTFGPDGWTS